MSVSKLWTDYSVKVGSSYIDGITSASVNQQLATAVESADGNVFATFGSLVKGSPAARFTTLDLAAALTASGVTATAIGSSPATVVVYFRSRLKGGTLTAAGTATHVSVTFAAGILVPRRISVRSGGNASMDLEVFGTSSDGTDPAAYSHAATLPGNTPGIEQVWGLGPLNLNGTDLEGVESVDFDFGVNVGLDSKDGDVFPTFSYVSAQRPSIRVRGVHLDDVLTAVTRDGAYYTASEVLVQYRARAEGGTFIDDGTASHVVFTLGKCRVEPQSFDGDPKTVDLLITPWEDTGGPTLPLAVSTASAIS